MSIPTKTKTPVYEGDALLEADITRVHREAGDGYVEVGPRSRTSRTGARRSAMTGETGEFWQAREFQWGQDDPRTIMSRASARTGGEPTFCRITKPETQTKVHVLADISRTLNFGFSREDKLWLMARSAVTCCLSLKDTQDLVLPALYANNEVVWTTHRAVTPASVSRQLARKILDPVYSQGTLDSGLKSALRLVPHHRSEVLILSDFLNLTDEHKAALASAAARHSVRAVVIQDERERFLPEPPFWWPFPAPINVFDLHTGKKTKWWLTARNRAQYTREFEEHERNLLAFFDKHSIRYEIVRTNEGHQATRKVLKLLEMPPLHR